MQIVKWRLLLFGAVLSVSGFSCRAGSAPASLAQLDTPRNLIIQAGAAAKIVAEAKRQAAEGAVYDASYQTLAYPNGDVPRDRGACTDVVIRALRSAGYDLQQLIHEDEAKHSYPNAPKRDANIDHRRCPNQAAYFRRFGKTLTLETTPPYRAEWRPGDIVYWKLPFGLDHTGVVSDRLGKSGLPMVVHNMEKCREEDVLTSWKIVGHFRFPNDL